MSDILHASYNIHDYVKDANSSFNVQSFNEIDGLVLTQIANMDLGSSGIGLENGSSKSFAQIWSEMNTDGTSAHDAFLHMSKDNQQLIHELAQSPRFSDLSVSNYVKNPCKSGVDGFPSVGKEQQMEQFAAVTITYKQNGETYNYVSYQATDGSTDGWAEDFAMLYSTDTQAQSDSAAYMNIIAEKTSGFITGGGHSKGGNNFEYAFLFCNDSARERIVKGYVYDSPGMNETVINNTEYYEKYKQITNGSFFCPQDSIIGQFLHEDENAVFIHSIEKGLLQHDPYSWQINKDTNTFVRDEQSETSKYLNEALDTAVKHMTQEEKEAFFAFIFYLLSTSDEGIDGLGRLFGKGWKNKDGSINWYKLKELLLVLDNEVWDKMTKEERKSFFKSLGSIVVGFLVVSVDWTITKIEGWVEEKKREIEQKIHEVWESVSIWFEEKKQRFNEFLDKTWTSIVTTFNRLKDWLFKQTKGGRYVFDHPQVDINTYSLHMYSGRLRDINRRISYVDSRLDTLYVRVGLQDLWTLLQADLLTGFSWKLLRCSEYLDITANEFDRIESKLIES